MEWRSIWESYHRGLVGKIIEVEHHTSEAILLLIRVFRGALVQRSREVGV